MPLADNVLKDNKDHDQGLARFTINLPDDGPAKSLPPEPARETQADPRAVAKPDPEPQPDAQPAPQPPPEILFTSDLRKLWADKDLQPPARMPWDSPPPPIPWLALERGTDVHPLEIQWLWPGRIPLGCLTVIAGDAEAGKSLITLDIAARVTTGAPWPDDPVSCETLLAMERYGMPRPAERVLIVSAQDQFQTVVLPRLEAAGADLGRVIYCESAYNHQDPIPALGARRAIRLPDDVPSLTEIVKERGVRLIILDPMSAFFGGLRESRVLTGPALLAPLADLAARHNLAIVCVTGLKREARGKGTYQAEGHKSLQAARVGWGIMEHPTREGKRVMLPIRNNVGPKGKGLNFRIEEGRIKWEEEPSRLTTEAAYAAERTRGGARVGARDWLQSFLATGPRPATEIYEQGSECGYAERTLDRAKSDLRIVSTRHVNNGDPEWIWSLEHKVALAL